MGIYDPIGGLQRIVIFRDANPNAEEVRKTVWHEIGHHFGMDEDAASRGEAAGVRRLERYEPVIGLEIHVQLRTRTKMFCGCELSFGDEPNIHTCPICLAHPGTLPVTNEQAIRYALQIGLALGLRDRPALDLPPQELLLSRQPEGVPDQPVRHPACHAPGGSATSASTASTSRRTRRSSSTSASRAGSTAPAPRSSTSTAAARRWSRSSPSPTSATRPRRASGCSSCGRRSRQIGASDVNMEEGSLRCDANVSLRPARQRRARA